MVDERTEPRRPDGLRILLAHDLSGASELAADLVAQASWPDASVIRIVSSPAGIGPALSSFADLRAVRAHDAETRAMIARAHERVTSDLRGADLTVESTTVHGKPERAIVAEARRFDADLIVVGARGQGSIEATLLGSASRAVVENAPCSVLVARSHRLGRVLLATDGSAPAAAATDAISHWPAFDDARILLVAVGEPAPRYPRTVLDTSEWRSAFRDTITSSTDRAFEAVERTADELEARGREVEIEVRLGDPAAEVIAAARDWPADLIALGSNGRPLLQRLFVGSVARRVLDGVDASVLVARPRAATPAPRFAG